MAGIVSSNLDLVAIRKLYERYRGSLLKLLSLPVLSKLHEFVKDTLEVLIPFDRIPINDNMLFFEITKDFVVDQRWDYVYYIDVNYDADPYITIRLESQERGLQILWFDARGLGLEVDESLELSRSATLKTMLFVIANYDRIAERFRALLEQRVRRARDTVCRLATLTLNLCNKPELDLDFGKPIPANRVWALKKELEELECDA